MSRPLRVLIVSHYYPPHLGGIENVARGEAVRLAAAGHEVVVVTSSPGGAVGAVWEDGVQVHRVATWNGIEGRTGVPFPVLSPALLVTLLLLARRADVVHVHDSLYITSWAAALAARLRRRPVVLTQHVEQVQHPSALVRRVQRVVYGSAGTFVLRTARQVAVLNDRVADFVRQRGVPGRRVSLLPNGVDTDLFRPPRPGEAAAARASFGLPSDGVLALFVGRFVPKKGFDLLIEAAAPVNGCDLVLAGGDGPAGPAVPGRHHLGALTPQRLAELYRAVDLFVLPSEAEGFPLTAQEAMASGLPVVLGDDPGYASYGLDRDLVRFAERTPVALRAILEELLADPRLRARMGEYARSVALAQFAWPAHVAGLCRLYRLAAAPAGGRAQGVTQDRAAG